MNQEISSLSSSSRLTSKPRASIEKAAPSDQTEQMAPSKEVQEVKQFEIEMEQINHAFALVKEVRQSLEKALENLE